MSAAVNWQVLPWEWADVDMKWLQALSIYLTAKGRASVPRQPMTHEQLAAAPNTMSREQSIKYLQEIGAIN